MLAPNSMQDSMRPAARNARTKKLRLDASSSALLLRPMYCVPRVASPELFLFSLVSHLYLHYCRATTFWATSRFSSSQSGCSRSSVSTSLIAKFGCTG